MALMSALEISASGMTAQRLRMDVISQNIANITTTRTGDGSPYKRKTVLIQEMTDVKPFSHYLNTILNRPPGQGGGVRVQRIVEDETPGPLVYEPAHPDADEEGYVEMPNVNIVTEMINMIAASRSYEANVTAVNITKGISSKTLEIIST